MENQIWHVYFLKCKDNSIYTGITTDLERRVRQHNGEIFGGAKYTKNKRPVKLVFSEQCLDKSDASKKEYSLRKLTRKAKMSLIKQSKYEH